MRRRYVWLVALVAAGVLVWLGRDRVGGGADATQPVTPAPSDVAHEGTKAARNDAEAEAWAAVQAMAAAQADPAADRRIAACDRAYRVALEGTFAAAASSVDADHHYVAALLAWSQSNKGRGTREWKANVLQRAALSFDQAVKAAPEDPLIAWSHARFCQGTHECDAGAAARRLQALEPDNAAVWLAAMGDAHAAGNIAAAEQHLARAAQASYYDPHYNDGMLRLLDGLARVPWPAACEAAMADILPADDSDRRPAREDVDAIFAFLLAHASEYLGAMPLSKSCPSASAGLPPPARRATCIAALARVAAGDTMFDQTSALLRLADYTTGGPEEAYWRERLRNFRWLQQEGWRHARHAPTRAIWEQGEVALYQRALEEAGRWPAPRGWEPRPR